LSIDIVFFLKGDVLADGKAIRIKSLYLFIAFYLASLKKSLPPHAYLYMRKVKSFNVHVSQPQKLVLNSFQENLTLGGVK